MEKVTKAYTQNKSGTYFFSHKQSYGKPLETGTQCGRRHNTRNASYVSAYGVPGAASWRENAIERLLNAPNGGVGGLGGVLLERTASARSGHIEKVFFFLFLICVLLIYLYLYMIFSQS